MPRCRRQQGQLAVLHVDVVEHLAGLDELAPHKSHVGRGDDAADVLGVGDHLGGCQRPRKAEPLAASIAAVFPIFAAVPDACASTNRVTWSVNEPDDDLRSPFLRFGHILMRAPVQVSTAPAGAGTG